MACATGAAGSLLKRKGAHVHAHVCTCICMRMRTHACGWWAYLREDDVHIHVWLACARTHPERNSHRRIAVAW